MESCIYFDGYARCILDNEKCITLNYKTCPKKSEASKPQRSEGQTCSDLLTANVKVLILGLKSMASTCNTENIEYYKGKAAAFNKAASMLEDTLNKSS